MKLNEAVAQRLKNLLEEKQWNQYNIQKNGGVPRSTVSVLIAQKRQTVKLNTLYYILATLGVSLKDFFDDPLFDDISD